METPQGLVKGHAYSITRVTYVDITTPNTTGKIPLLRLRNPWGNEAEWNGPWSDKYALFNILRLCCVIIILTRQSIKVILILFIILLI